MSAFDKQLVKLADGTIDPDVVQSNSSALTVNERRVLLEAIAVKAANGGYLEILT